jgi:hypothetical protein
MMKRKKENILRKDIPRTRRTQSREKKKVAKKNERYFQDLTSSRFVSEKLKYTKLYNSTLYGCYKLGLSQ